MTDVGRMSVQELLGKVLADEHADVLRQAVVWLAQELMEAEVSERAGAGYGERHPDRVARRNGYRERAWDTRVGSIELAIPRLRSGSYFPSFLAPRRRSEQALVAVVQEAYINGVSTRKVDRLVEALGLAGVSKDQVSRLCRGLDEQVTAVTPPPSAPCALPAGPGRPSAATARPWPSTATAACCRPPAWLRWPAGSTRGAATPPALMPGWPTPWLPTTSRPASSPARS
jgi:Transposase, Mutator family